MCCKKTFLISFVIFLGFSVSFFSQTNFVEHPKNPVFQGTLNSWDAFVVLTGSVNYVDGKYHMYYCGQETPWGSGDYQMDIGYASSDDGITWEKHKNNPILRYDRDNWEKNGFNDVTVLKIDNMWHMWYETLPTNYPNDHSFEIGYAFSDDGYNWQRHEEKLNIGTDEGKWDSGTFTVQDVIYDGEKFLMYYVGDTTWENQARFQVGVAESEDGINWIKDTLLNPIIMRSGPLYNSGIWSLDVLFDSTNTNATYQMWYTRYDNVNADKVFYAKSFDGKNWIEKEEPLFACENFPWAKIWPDDLEVCYVDGIYHLWLYGINGNTSSATGSGVGYFVDASNASKERVLYVPTEYTIIQDAIDAADSGDVVIIEEGTYYQQFSFEGKAITVGSRYLIDDSTSHIEKTIIDGSTFSEQDSASIVSFISGEHSNSVLAGLTLQNGAGTYELGTDGSTKFRFGGAIAMIESGGSIKDNVFKNNSILLPNLNFVTGGAIACFFLPEDKTVIIENNEFFNNSVKGINSWGGAIDFEVVDGPVIIEKNILIDNSVNGSSQGNGGGICIIEGMNGQINISNNFVNNNVVRGGADDGGGIFAMNCKVNINNNIITENSCYGSSHGRGGGISVGNWSASNPSESIANITNNTIIDNIAQSKGSGIYVNSMPVSIMNNIIRDNTDPTDIQININGSYEKKVEYSNIEGGYEGEGNIDDDPSFIDSVYCILPESNSPCIDEGNPDPMYNDREVDPFYPARGTLRNDMGAFGGPYSKWAEMPIIPADPATSIRGDFEFIPEEFSLSQNYPNPFNPSTTINYSIPHSSVIANGVKQSQEITLVNSFPRNDEVNVKLIVYDILGSEVAILVNEKQKPGNYEVEFNCHSGAYRNLTSGVYFYKLSAGDFIQTKKMMMLK